VSDDARCPHCGQSMAGTPDAETARVRLLRLMRDLSEAVWFAGWLIDLERECYRAAHADPATLPAETECITGIGREDAAELRRLSEIAGGWWTWSKGDGREAFVPGWQP